ncbi:hypothetical protein N7450_001783 [Penicillium hetheringtonii]|uniref:Uncharacterized protein n=1 Tax=Penicillium hetheringtonii TaxID=911720 RepID=A0AAD6E598_9EURO|nr:hypothetical protein N7450_001783 [Penicillium hetheringtonii]
MEPFRVTLRSTQKRKARAASRGFTHEYQNAREQEDNTICHKQLAPATLRNYEDTALNWALLVIPIPIWDH